MLRIRIKKGQDGPDTLVCYRADGSHTMQHDRTGGFFPIHDLTHYAVETVLGLEEAFYGLLASGWDLSDFGRPWKRGRLKPEALTAEFVVGALDLERAGGYQMSAADLTDMVRAKHGANPDHGFTEITEQHLAAIRGRMRELFRRWHDTRPGDALELVFPPADVGATGSRR